MCELVLLDCLDAVSPCVPRATSPSDSIWFTMRMKACFTRDIFLVQLAAVGSIPEGICRHAAMYAVGLAGWAVAALQMIIIYYC
jgi:hypothetical protein